MNHDNMIKAIELTEMNEHLTDDVIKHTITWIPAALELPLDEISTTDELFRRLGLQGHFVPHEPYSKKVLLSRRIHYKPCPLLLAYQPDPWKNYIVAYLRSSFNKTYGRAAIQFAGNRTIDYDNRKLFASSIEKFLKIVPFFLTPANSYLDSIASPFDISVGEKEVAISLLLDHFDPPFELMDPWSYPMYQYMNGLESVIQTGYPIEVEYDFLPRHPRIDAFDHLADYTICWEQKFLEFHRGRNATKNPEFLVPQGFLVGAGDIADAANEIDQNTKVFSNLSEAADMFKKTLESWDFDNVSSNFLGGIDKPQNMSKLQEFIKNYNSKQKPEEHIPDTLFNEIFSEKRHTANKRTLRFKIFTAILSSAAAIWFAMSPSFISGSALAVSLSAFFFLHDFSIPDCLKEGFDSILNLFKKGLAYMTEDGSEREENLVPQNFKDFTDPAALLLAGVVSSGVGFEGKISTKSILQDLGNLPKTVSGFSTAIDIVITMFENIINYVRVEWLDMNGYRFRSTQMQDVDTYIDAVNDLSRKYSSEDLFADASNLSHLHAVRTDGNELLKKIPRTKDTEGAVMLLRTAVQNVSKMAAEFERNKINLTGARQEPVCIFLQGPTGTGKSIAMQHLTQMICAKTLNEDMHEAYLRNPANFVFNHQFENGYYEGYKATTTVTQIDEFMQSRDIAGSPDNEVMQMFRMINSAEMNMHAATLEKKGHMKFHSKAVVCTSNVKKLTAPSIKDVAALERRLTFRFLVVPRPEYCEDPTTGHWSKKLKKMNLPKKTFKFKGENKLMTDIDPSLQHFFVTDDNGDAVGEPLTFETVCDMVSQAIDDREIWFASHKDNFANTYNKYRSKFHPHIESQAWHPQWKRHVVVTPNMYDLYLPEILEDFRKVEHFVNTSRMYPVYALANSRCSGYIWNCDVETLMGIIYLFGYEVILNAHEEQSWDEPMVEWHVPIAPLAVIPRIGRVSETWFQGVTCGVFDIFHSVRDWLNGSNGRLTCFLASQFVISFFCGMVGHYVVLTFVKWFWPDLDSQSFGHSSKVKTRNSKVKGKNKYPTKLSELQALRPQSAAHDKNGEDITNSAVRSNMFYLIVEDAENGKEQKMGNVLFIKGRIAIIPVHFVVTLSSLIEEYPSYGESVVRITKECTKSRASQMVCSVHDLLNGIDSTEALMSNDLALIQFPSHFNEFRDITKHFLTLSDLPHFNTVLNVYITETHGNKIKTMATPVNQEKHVNPPDATPYTIRKSYSYQGAEASGMCGALLTVLNPCAQRKFAGIHVAGDTRSNVGYSSSVTQDELCEALKSFENVTEVMEPENVLVSQSDFLPQYVQFGKPSKKIHLGSNTKIIPSPLHDTYWKCETTTSRLIPFYNNLGEKVDPWIFAMDKYGFRKFYVSRLLRDDIMESYSQNYYMTRVYKVERRLLTWEECVYGIPDDPTLGSIKFSSGSGYRFRFEKDLKKTISAEKDDPVVQENLKTLYSTLEHYNRLYKQNKRPFWVSLDCLKDERVSLSKAEIGKTRLFSSCEFLFQLLFQKYFGAFFGEYIKNMGLHEGMVGVNPYSAQWDTLFRNFTKFESLPLVGAGDFKHYDGSHSEIMMELFLKFVNSWYNDDYSLIRRLLFQDIMHSNHCVIDFIVQWFGSLSSGCPGTTIINCFLNGCYFRLAWIKAGLPIHEFNSKVVLKVFGDDNLWCVHPEYRHIFNELTVPSFMAEFGMEYTLETKGDAIYEFRHLTEVEFLKRSFRFSPELGRYVGPLRLSVTLEIPCWTKSDDPINICFSNVETSLRELSFHGKEIYEAYADKMIEGFVSAYPSYTFPRPLHTSYTYKLMETAQLDMCL